MADELCRKLEKAGAVVIGPASSVKRALSLVENRMAIDAALLEVSLSGELAYPAAEEFKAQRCLENVNWNHKNCRQARLLPDLKVYF